MYRFSTYKRQYKANLKLALPVVMTQLGQILVQVADNVMVGRYGGDDPTPLAATSFGGSVFFILFIAGVGIATGNLDSTYGSNAMLAAVVLVAKGLIDLAAGVAGIKGANKPSQVDGAFKLGIVAAIATIAQAALTLPALGGSAVNIVAFVIEVYDLFFVQQAHAVKAENRDRL